MPERTPYAAVKTACEEGRGCRLTFDECARLMLDEAFAIRAAMDADGVDDLDDYSKHPTPGGVKRTPKKKRWF